MRAARQERLATETTEQRDARLERLREAQQERSAAETAELSMFQTTTTFARYGHASILETAAGVHSLNSCDEDAAGDRGWAELPGL